MMGLYLSAMELAVRLSKGIPYIVKSTNEEARGLIQKIKGLMTRTGEESKFASYLSSVRTAHKPKRNFMKLLERI